MLKGDIHYVPSWLAIACQTENSTARGRWLSSKNYGPVRDGRDPLESSHIHHAPTINDQQSVYSIERVGD